MKRIFTIGLGIVLFCVFNLSSSFTKPKIGTLNDHEWVDLGLSVKWATCNVGATSPSDYGGYFAWSEMMPKNDYSWSTLRYCIDGSGKAFTKYNTAKEYGIVDKKEVLDLSNDAARSIWGKGWRMPTDAEITELKEKCTWTWTTNGGKYGYKVTSKTNGNSIFLPAAGYRSGDGLYEAGSIGYYWSSSLNADHPFYAWLLSFNSNEPYIRSYYRYLGFSVRPVTE